VKKLIAAAAFLLLLGTKAGAQDIYKTGTIAAANCAAPLGGVMVDVAGHGIAGFAVTGSFTGEIDIQGSVDDTGIFWDSLQAQTAGGGSVSLPLNSPIQGIVSVAGLKRIRACAVSFTPGIPATVLFRVSAAPGRDANVTILGGAVGLTNITPGNPSAVRCVDVTGSFYEPCGGGTGGAGLTDTELRAAPVPVSVSGVATAGNQTTGNSSLASIDTKTPALVSGRQPVDPSGVTSPISAVSLPLPTLAATSTLQTTGNNSLASIDTKLTSPLTVTGALTDSQLRATPVPVSGPVTDTQLRATPVPVSGPLTDTQLRATPVPVSGTVGTKTALTANSPATSSVGVASAQAVASNVSRKGLVIVNLSNATVSLAIGSTAVLNSGITLQPGAAWTMNEYTYATGAVNAIASGAASTIAVQEFQ
jgi:hypothetical protein